MSGGVTRLPKEVMDQIVKEARGLRRQQLERRAVEEARVLLTLEEIKPSVRAQMAADRLVAAYRRLEALQDG